MLISEFIEKNFPKTLILPEVDENSNADLFYEGDGRLVNAEWYYENAKEDAVFGYECIKKYLRKNIKILEIGGGSHFLSQYLSFKGYQIVSIEPGNFQGGVIEKIRDKTKSKKNSNLKIIDTNLESFIKNNDISFDFIFSVNVLEHVDNIEVHLNKALLLLKNNQSIMCICCPNYTFPYDTHFFKFFIPFFPKFTFTKILKNKLVKIFGKKKYYELLHGINFNCTYFKIKKMKLHVKFCNSMRIIFDRFEKEDHFQERHFTNKLVKYTYKVLCVTKIKNILVNFFPRSLSPFLIMEFKKKNFQ